VKFFAGLGDRLRQGLRRSQQLFVGELTEIFAPERALDDALFQELEEVLIAADLGAPLAADFVNRAREEVTFGTVTKADQLRPLFRRFLLDILKPASQALDLDHRPAVVLMLGVKVQKTTTSAAGRSDKRLKGHSGGGGHLPCCRHRAVVSWGDRVGRSDPSDRWPDPAAVVFDAPRRQARHRCLVIDTAGRFHTKSNLMDEPS
jgi:fused signal recognition particle receptor